MGKIFFVDSENVGDYWVSLLDFLSDEDEMLVFYTSKSPNMCYKSLIRLRESRKPVSFIECFEGNNGLDFQLCSILGYKLSEQKDKSPCIISSDTGYDAVVKFWKAKGISISRFGAKTPVASIFSSPRPEETVPPAAAKKRSEEKPVPAEKKREEPPQPAEVPAEPAPAAVPAADTDAAAREILYIIGRESLTELHAALVAMFGSKKGVAYYNGFKSDTAYSSFIQKHEKWDISEKQEHYCRLVFENETEPMPKDFATFAVNTWKQKKNLNSFRASLEGKYGKEHGDKLYAIIKSHIKILTILK